jgi:hypothetical protein
VVKVVKANVEDKVKEEGEEAREEEVEVNEGIEEEVNLIEGLRIGSREKMRWKMRRS